jgi:lipopolysaccharide biosynthesis protein
LHNSDFGDLLSSELEPIFWVPERLGRPSAWWGHVPFAFWLIAKCRPRLLVELGTHYGVSYAAFCEAVSRLRLGSRCYAVDTWEGDPHAGVYGGEVFLELKDFHDKRYSSFSQLVCSTFDEACGDFADGSIDLLHIDGFHTYEAAHRDFVTWRPKLSSRAIVLLHDTNERQRDFGVWRLFDELKQEVPTFEFLHAHGLGVVAVGAEAPEVIRRLCGLTDVAKIASIRERFSVIGAHWIAEQEKSNLAAHAHKFEELAAHAHKFEELAAHAQKFEEAVGQVRVLDDALARERIHTHTLDELLARERVRSRALETDIIQTTGRIGGLEINLARSRDISHELLRRVQQLENDARALADEYTRQLATLKRAEYRNQLPSNLVGWGGLIPSRRKKLRKLARDYRILASSPLFDARWYLANNPDVAATQIDPVLHYLHHGAHEGRQPGPLFDAAAYLSRYEDLATKNENPLLHYIGHGHREGRAVRQVHEASTLSSENISGSTVGATAGTVAANPGLPRGSIRYDCSVAVPFSYRTTPEVAKHSIAVIIHIFYPELAPEFRYYIEHISGPVDVFISTIDQASQLLIEEAFRTWKAGTLEIRVTPNRGRDIAPKLVVFRDVYDRYDLVLHLHSKRSHHSGSLASWRRHILETLVGDSLITASVIDAFDQNPLLGMIAPSHFEMVRDCLSWGGNFARAARLARRMDFSICSETPFDFPSGSMLWIRSAALRPLLDLNLTMDDFDVEDGQLDGTLAHVIERLYFYVCERAGLRWMKISRPDLFPTSSIVHKIERPNDVGRVLYKHSPRLLEPAQCGFHAPMHEYVSITTGAPLSKKPAKLIAFYLPQFHPIPENDAWWGKGFTEWTNARAARPLFEGHYQPHIPIDLEYYNLLEDGVLNRQAEQAKLYGIEGFCFYYYWFGGKKLLSKPLDKFLVDKQIDVSFCLCWGNENWTRRWDGLENEILIAQSHSDSDDIEFIKSVSLFMRDERYIRVNGMPLLLVYRPNLFPSPSDTAYRWRLWCAENGIGPIYLAYTQSFEKVDPKVYGFDAAVEFPPNNTAPRDVTNAVTPIGNQVFGTVYDWNSYFESSYSYCDSDYKLFRSVCPMWDNTPRRKNNATIFVNNTPASYRRWLLNAIDDTAKVATNADERLIFINAWNEWGEGAHLEPDAKNGYAYLQATRDALEAYSCAENKP